MFYKLLPTIFIITGLLVFTFSCKPGYDREQEPNNTFAEANDLTIGRPMQGMIDSVDDVDYYKIFVESRSVLSAELTGLRGINLSMKFFKHDSPPVLLKHIDDARKSSPEFLTNVYVEPGIYYIKVEQGARDPKSANTENYYTLRVKTRDYFYEEKEPNDTPEQATEILPGHDMRGYFSPAYNPMNSDDPDHPYREYDWFKFDVQLRHDRPLSAEISISGVPNIDSSLSLFDPDLELITRSEHNRTGEPENLSNVGLTRSGTYYIRTEAKGYMVNYDTPYKLSVNLNHHNPLYELEPNDTIEQANPIKDGLIYGDFGHQQDIDVFYYKPREGPGFYRVELTPSPSINPEMRILDANENTVAEPGRREPGSTVIYPNLHISEYVYFVLSTGLFIPDKSSEYALNVERVEIKGLVDYEPNDTRSEAVRLEDRDIIKGFTSIEGDVDFFLLEFNTRKRIEFEAAGGKNSHIKVSITDPMGYTISEYESKEGRTVTFTEMIDQKGYIIVESILEDYDNPYIINLRKK